MKNRYWVQNARKKLTERQNTLLDKLLEHNRQECCAALDELRAVLGTDEEHAVQCLREDLKALQGASYWIPVEDGEKLIGLVDKAVIDTAARTVWVRMGLDPNEFEK